MTLVFTIIALIGLIIFAIGAVLWLLIKPTNPVNVMMMVIGGLVFAVAEIVLLFDAVF
jgi:uncharacterized membrane protein YhfC